MRKVAIIVLNYRMAEMTDRLVARIKEVTRWPHDLFVIDNGSPGDRPGNGEIAASTTHRCSPNRRLTGGFNFGIEVARAHEIDPVVGDHPEDLKYDAFWLVCNDVRLRKPIDVVAACMAQVERARQAGQPIGIIHPSMEPDPATWNHADMVWHGPAGVRDTDWADIICPIYTREAMEAAGWRFNPELVYGWGIDRESSYLCWKNGLRVTVCDDVQVWHHMGTTYEAGKDPEFKDFDAYKKAAGGAQWPVLQRLYGDYEKVFARARPEFYERRRRT